MESSLLNEKKLDKSSPEKAEKMNGENTVKVYGPYKRKDGRQHIVKVVNGVKTTQSYPRYIMEQHLGRELLPEETVDHIDEDFTNDDISNLRLISLKDNNSRSQHRRDVSRKYNCIWCGNELYLTKGQVRSSLEKKSGPFCSKRCSGQYGAALQSGKTNKLFSSVERSYFKIDLDGTKTFLGTNTHFMKKKISKKTLDSEKKYP